MSIRHLMMAKAAVGGGGGGGAVDSIVPDAVSSVAYASAAPSSVTLPHICTGANRLLTVGLYADTQYVTTVTYAGVAMTLAREYITNLRLYYLIAPATGTNNISVGLSYNSVIRIVATSYTGCHQTNQGVTIVTSADGSNTTHAVPMTTVTAQSWAMGINYSSIDCQTGGSGTERRAFCGTSLYNGYLQLCDSNHGVNPAGSYTLNFRGSIPTDGHNAICMAILPSG